MLKQKVENKSGEKPTFVSTMTGEQIPLEAVQDRDRLGHARPGPYTGPEFEACRHYGLLRPDGRPFIGLVTTSQDPMQPRREEAPANLLRAAAQAQAAFDAHDAALRAAQDVIIKAQVDHRLAAQRGDKASYNRGIVAEQKAVEHYRTLGQETPSISKHVSDAELALKWWLDDERLRRYGLVAEPQPAIF